jgi:hypothetical protein
MTKVRFLVNELCDARSCGSELNVGNIHTGELIEGKVHYLDKTGDHWIFYPGDTCEIVEVLP